MLVELLCNYCNYKYTKMVYSKAVLDKECCPRCHDSSLKIKDQDHSKVDYYQGSPPFVERSRDKDDEDYFSFDIFKST